MKFNISTDQISTFCQKWQIKEMCLFGSVLRDDFTSDSDIDVLVSFASEVRCSLFDLVRMENELKDLWGRQVDLISRRGVESSRNYLRRDAILSSANVIYAA